MREPADQEMIRWLAARIRDIESADRKDHDLTIFADALLKIRGETTDANALRIAESALRETGNL